MTGSLWRRFRRRAVVPGFSNDCWPEMPEKGPVLPNCGGPVVCVREAGVYAFSRMVRRPRVMTYCRTPRRSMYKVKASQRALLPIHGRRA